MPLRNAHIVEPLGKSGRKRAEPHPVGHRRSDRTNPCVSLCQLTDLLPEDGGEARLIGGLNRTAGHVKLRHAVVELRLPLGVGVALALDRLDMYHRGPVKRLCPLQKVKNPLFIVAIHLSEVLKAQLLKHRLTTEHMADIPLDPPHELDRCLSENRHMAQSRCCFSSQTSCRRLFRPP